MLFKSFAVNTVSGMECSKCNEEAHTARELGNVEAVDPCLVPALQHMVTCLIPSHWIALYTGHYEATALPHVIEPDTTPRPVVAVAETGVPLFGGDALWQLVGGGERALRRIGHGYPY